MEGVSISYGFTSTMTARPGLGDRVVDLLLSGLEPGKPASSEHCLLHLVSRSASAPDIVHVAEGWSSEEEHHRVFATPAAAAITISNLPATCHTAPSSALGAGRPPPPARAPRAPRSSRALGASRALS